MNAGRVCQDKGRLSDGLVCQLVIGGRRKTSACDELGLEPFRDFKRGCLCVASRKIRATWIFLTGLCLT